MKTEETIKEFLTKMSTQDNRATAFPYFYVVRERVHRPAPLENCDEVKVICDGFVYDSREQLADLLKQDGHPEEDIQKSLRKARDYGIKHGWENHGMFLTESDAENHLKQNFHRYSKEAHTYVDHAWRAPELEKFLLALFEHFGVNPPKR